MTKTALISSFFLFFSQMVSQMVVRFFHWRIAILAQILIGHTIGLQKKLILAPFSEKFFFHFASDLISPQQDKKLGKIFLRSESVTLATFPAFVGSDTIGQYRDCGLIY